MFDWILTLETMTLSSTTLLAAWSYVATRREYAAEHGRRIEDGEALAGRLEA